MKRRNTIVIIALLAATVRSDRLDLAINTDQPVGTVYRFWTVSVFTSQHQFMDERYAQQLKLDKPYLKEASCVRLLGGRDDGRNNWYQGVGENGKVKVDFTDLVNYLKAIIDQGYTPRLVLDNVPTAMSTIEEMHTYGNTNPPDNEDLWHQYISRLVEKLVSEFGMEQVASWRFRVGTEPDLFPGHWNGTREQYFKHYDITVDAVTQIIPEADIGPGNILNPMREQKQKDRIAALEGKEKGWGLDIIDHCGAGTNCVTGRIGTRMQHFSISYYNGVGQPIVLEECIQKVRERLNRYPQFRDIPVELGEFGILWDEQRRRLWGNDITEWGASWYAAIADVIYRNGVANAFEWNQTTSRLPHPRLLVNQMLEKMADGKRLEVKATGKATGRAGAIACTKGGKVYLLLYNHQPPREPKVMNTLSLNIKGAVMAGPCGWRMNEWTIDHDHGVWAYEMYRDCEAAGLEPIPQSPLYGGQPQRRFGKAWARLFAKNRAKYEPFAVLPQTAAGQPVAVQGGSITMEFDMPGHSVRLIELVPDKKGIEQ